jgi:subtilisin-like proprotein convertase family protein
MKSRAADHHLYRPDVTSCRSMPLRVSVLLASILAAIVALPASAIAQTFTSTAPQTPQAIPDSPAPGITSTITVPGGTGVVTDVNALLDINHTFIGDLIVRLTSPGGTSVLLLDELSGGVDGENLVGSYLFDDESLNSVPTSPGIANPPIPPGDYLPVGSLASFDGELADGTWSLFISDNQSADVGTLNLWQLLFTTIPTGGQIYGTAAQSNVFHQNLQYRVLRDQIGNTFRDGPPTDDFTMILPAAVPESLEGIQLAGFSQPSMDDDVIIRGQDCGSCGESLACKNGWDGWIVGYGAGGSVQAQAGVGGLNYGTGGTQVGIYRWLDNETLAGFFGGYGYQSVNLSGGDGANINSSTIGGFLRTGDCGRYWLAAGSVGYDTYDSTRVSGVVVNRGDYDGFQGSAYMERGWIRNRGSVRYIPNVALQYVGLRQGRFTETGLGGIAVNSVQTNSLRAKIGVDAEKLIRSKQGRSLFLEGRAHYMHEFLDRNTIVAANVGGNAFSRAGLDFGRDYVVIGTGLKLETRRGFELQAGYDLQANNRQNLHTGTGSISYLY